MQKVSSPRLIVALDTADPAKLDLLLAQLDPQLCRVKVGKELFTALGPSVIDAVHAQGFELFLDLKYHDIPNTVAAACRVAADAGVWMLNVHALGGKAMLTAARESIQQSMHSPLLIGVTLLTSMGESELIELGITLSPTELVQHLARLSHQAGLDGVVCSAQEARLIKNELGTDFVLVTPGIRLPSDASHDQQRIVSPQQAMENGADFLVVGRPITQADSPADKLREFARLLSS